MDTIETRLVYGFLDAGKTTYIRQCIRDDRFYKYGSTLILCFEQGEDVLRLGFGRSAGVRYDRCLRQEEGKAQGKGAAYGERS